MMSEFDEHGNKRFQNGFEKLAFYFDSITVVWSKVKS